MFKAFGFTESPTYYLHSQLKYTHTKKKYNSLTKEEK